MTKKPTKNRLARAAVSSNRVVSPFRERYVLATGYPWATGIGPYFEVQMHDRQMAGGNKVKIRWPNALWKKSLPKYRLVLERVGANDQAHRSAPGVTVERNQEK